MPGDKRPTGGCHPVYGGVPWGMTTSLTPISHEDIAAVRRVEDAARAAWPIWVEIQNLTDPEAYSFYGVDHGYATYVFQPPHEGYRDREDESIPLGDLLEPDGLVARMEAAQAQRQAAEAAKVAKDAADAARQQVRADERRRARARQALTDLAATDPDLVSEVLGGWPATSPGTPPA